VAQQLKQIGALHIQDMLLLGNVAVHGIVPDHLLIDLANEHATHAFHA